MYLSTPLTETHDFSKFSCGRESLDEWLAVAALRAQRAGAARTYVWTDGQTDAVWAYFALAPTEVVRASEGISRGMSGGYSRIPGYLLGRLALHQQLQGQGLGGQLLVDAVSRVVEAAKVGGGRLVVVDAPDQEAATFYARYGSVPVLSRPNRLIMKVATARAALGGAD